MVNAISNQDLLSNKWRNTEMPEYSFLVIWKKHQKKDKRKPTSIDNMIWSKESLIRKARKSD